VAGVAALATRQGLLTILFGARSPRCRHLVGAPVAAPAHALFAALIPIEEVVSSPVRDHQPVAGSCSPSRTAVPRLGHLRLGAMRRQPGRTSPGPRERRLGHRRGNGLGQIMTLLQLFVIAVFVADFVVHRPATVRSILGAQLSAAATALIGIRRTS